MSGFNKDGCCKHRTVDRITAQWGLESEDGCCKHRTVDHITAQWGLESVNGLVHCILYLHLPHLGRPHPLCIHCLHEECKLFWNNNNKVIRQAYNI